MFTWEKWGKERKEKNKRNTNFLDAFRAAGKRDGTGQAESSVTSDTSATVPPNYLIQPNGHCCPALCHRSGELRGPWCWNKDVIKSCPM